MVKSDFQKTSTSASSRLKGKTRLQHKEQQNFEKLFKQ